MSFENANRLSHQELSVLQDKKQLTALKTQIESDNELKNRFLEHYMTYIDRSTNEQSKKYVTDLFIKAIKFFSLVPENQIFGTSNNNLKDLITTIIYPEAKSEAINKPEQTDDTETKIQQSQSISTQVDPQASNETSTSVTNALSKSQSSAPDSMNDGGLFGPMAIDINKQLTLDSPIDFGTMLQNAYAGIKKIKSLSAEVQKKDLSTRIKKINALGSNSSDDNEILVLMDTHSSIFEILPESIADGMKKNYSDILSSIKSDPEKFTQYKQAMITGITLCSNGFVDAVCDELLSGGVELYKSLPNITSSNVNNSDTQKQFMDTTIKIMRLLQGSLKKGLDVSMSSLLPGSKEIMSAMSTKLGGLINSPIPNPQSQNYDTELKQGFYFIINTINGSNIFTRNIMKKMDDDYPTQSTQVQEYEYSDDEIHQIAENISSQQLKIFTKCHDLKFGVFRDKEYKTTNPDGSIFQVTKEKEKGTVYYSMTYEKRSPTTGKIITSYRLDLDKNGMIKKYLALSKSTFDRTGRGVLKFTDSGLKNSDFAMKRIDLLGKDMQTDLKIMNTMLEQIQKI